MPFTSVYSYQGTHPSRDGWQVDIQLGFTGGATHHCSDEDATTMIVNNFNSIVAATGTDPYINQYHNLAWNVQIAGGVPANATSFHMEWSEQNDPSAHTSTIQVRVYHIQYAQAHYSAEAQKSFRQRWELIKDRKFNGPN